MIKIKIKLEYRCFPIWYYGESGNLLSNELPDHLIGDAQIDPIFMHLQAKFDALFRDDGKGFEYTGLADNNAKNEFAKLLDDAERLLRHKAGDLYGVENCVNPDAM